MRRRIRKILILFVLSLFLCVSSFAQNKIAVIESRAFDVEEQGITELIIANKTLDEEFEPFQRELKFLNDKLLKFIIEVDRCSRVHCIIERSYEESQKMILEAETLSKKIKEITDEINPQIKKRKFELIEPINKRIAEKLEVFKKNKGYLLIIDQSEIEKGIITDNPSAEDITKEFIKFCNEEFEKEKSQKR